MSFLGFGPLTPTARRLVSKVSGAASPMFVSKPPPSFAEVVAQPSSVPPPPVSSAVFPSATTSKPPPPASAAVVASKAPSRGRRKLATTAPVVDPPLVINKPTKRSLKYKPQGLAPAPASSIHLKEQSKRVEARVEAQVEAQLKENFKQEYDDEAKAKEDFIQKEKEIVKEIVKQPETTSIVEKVSVENKKQYIAAWVAQLISTQIQGLSSIPVFQEYTPEQIKDFVLKNFPDDAISVLDNFKNLSPASRQEILDFIILKCKGVTLNARVDHASPVTDVYNKLGIRSLSLPAVAGIPVVDGILSSARALVVCEPESCPAAGVADWCCCIESSVGFDKIKELILKQDSPFVTAHPDIGRMINQSCNSGLVPVAAQRVDDPPEFHDPQGFAAPFPSVIIGDGGIVYSIGPIIDAESILGRPLIMIRIHNYKNEDYPNGIYFWVYPSFSEGGASRVFLIIGGRQFMKGPDYTLTTFIIDLLQVHINKYYTDHFVLKQGPGFSPTILSTQQEVICFFGDMIHLQTIWVHDLIAGRGLNLEADPIGYVPPGFNRHCYTFHSSLPMKRWIVSGIDDVGRYRDSPQIEFLAEQFLTDNQIYTRQQSLASSFPLYCCLTTIFDKYRDETDVNDFFALFKRWPDTRFVQGCNVVPGVSPVGCVVAGTSSNLQGMRYNIFLEHLAPLEFVKRFKSLRLVQPIVTPDPGELFTMIRRMGRSDLLVKKRTLLGIEPAQVETCLMEVDLDSAIKKINKELKKRRVKRPNALIYPHEQEAIIFGHLPKALHETIDKISDIFFHYRPDHPLIKIKECFKNFIGLIGCPWDNPDQFKRHIVIKSLDISRRDGLITSITIIKDSPLYRLIRTLETGVYRHLLMSSMLDEYTGMASFPLDITPRLGGVLTPRVSCAFLNSDGQYVELPGRFGKGSLGNCDFSGVFQHPLFNPYIFSATRKSMTFPDGILERYIRNPKIVTPDLAASHATIPVKVHNKMFLIRLVFYTTTCAIQIVVCVSSTICIASPMGGPPSIPFGVDFQFNVVSIGPLRANEGGPGMSANATILATMCDYLSLGCMGASKKGEYSLTSGSPQFFDYFDNFFKLINTECFTYVSAYMSPFNCGKDLVMKHFGRVFERYGDNDISIAIRGRWGWFPYLKRVQPEVCLGSRDGVIDQAMIEVAVTSGRRDMQLVVQVFFDPILGVLDEHAVGDETGHVGSEVSSAASSPARPESGSDSGSDSYQSTTTNDDRLYGAILVGESFPSQDSDASYESQKSMGSQSSQGSASSNSQGSASSVGMEGYQVGDTYGGGRGRTNRKTRKRKYKTNRRSKSKSKSKPKHTNIRRCTRKNTDVSRTRTKTTTRTKTMKIKSKKFPKRIYLYSTPRTAQRMAYKYLGRVKTAKLYPARNPAKKYMIFDPKNNKWVNFGQMGYEDYTKHHDKTRRKNYLTRTKGMLGDWKSNKYSANNLSRSILW